MSAVADSVLEGKGVLSETPVVDEFVEVVESAEPPADPEESGDAE